MSPSRLQRAWQWDLAFEHSRNLSAHLIGWRARPIQFLGPTHPIPIGTGGVAALCSNLVLFRLIRHKGRKPHRTQIRVRCTRSRSSVENFHWRDGGRARDAFVCGWHGPYSTGCDNRGRRSGSRGPRPDSRGRRPHSGWAEAPGMKAHLWQGAGFRIEVTS
jgi:hypothetical protein